MPQYFDKHSIKPQLQLAAKKVEGLRDWLSLMISDAKASRSLLEATWRDALKRYEGVPRISSRDVPVENAPNIHVTIGAISVDTIYAQVIDLIFGSDPFITCRTKPKGLDNDKLNKAVKALQRFVNHVTGAKETHLVEAVESSVLDNIQLGSGFFYVPWVERVKKTKTAKVLSAGPIIRTVAPEDMIVPFSSRHLLDDMPVMGLNLYYTEQELKHVAKVNGWDISGFKPMGAQNWVTQRRESLGRVPDNQTMKGDTYCVQLLFCYFDIDGDGIEEDLLVIYNDDGLAVGYVSYNPMDRRPFSTMVYQRRAHMFYGLGVLDMLKPYEEKLTDVHNYATLNILLANSRVWVGDGSVPDDLSIYPGMVLGGLSGPEALAPLQMADVYSSIWQDQQMMMQLANQRVGISSAMASPEVPNRTAGITTMSMLQQVNRRFTPAFNSMRDGVAEAVRQCLYRYQEQVLAGNSLSKASIVEILGQDGLLVLDLLGDEKFDEAVSVDLTAVSATVNREADRQNAILLTNLLGQYQQRTLELAQLAGNPQVPEGIRNIAVKAAKAGGEIIDRTIRTFDSLRDPETFVIDVEKEMKDLEQGAGITQSQMVQLFQSLLQQQQMLEIPEQRMV